MRRILTDKLYVSKLNHSYIKITCEPGLAYELNEYFTFDVPGAKWSPQFKSRFWDGKIRLYNVMAATLYAGLLYYVELFCQERRYELVYVDDFAAQEFSVKEALDFIKTLNIPAKYEVRDYQLEAFVHAVRERRSLFLSPTASGKSFIIYLIVRYYQHVQDNSKLLIIVPTTSLVSQLAGDFADYGFPADGNVHKIYAGEDKFSNCPITISTWQSIYKMDKRYFGLFDVVIGDEAHLFKAKSLVSILSKCENAEYRFGFTGTLDGTHTHKLVLEGLFGRVRKVTTTAKLIEQKHLSNFKVKAIVLKYPELVRREMSKGSNKDYVKELDFIVRNKRRNAFIKNLALSLEGNTLILFQFVDKHGKVLYDIINKAVAEGRKVFYVSGDVQGEEREAIRRAVEQETNCIIVASMVFATGINIVNLRNVIFASPSKSRIRTLQSIGRVLRRSALSTEAVLFDIADDLHWKSRQNHTLKHFIERIKLYSQEKFPYKIYTISFKE
ncbi:MAG: DEAD/DEAH box helicase family protein [Candidatus Bathyarchaeia archaeon]